MRNVRFVAILCLSLATGTGTVHASEMSWWGNTGATSSPQPDTHCGCGEPRTGYWWWPKVAESNVDDAELWGNRGVVFHAWERKTAEEEPVARTYERVNGHGRWVLNAILFDFGKAIVRPEGRAELDRLIAEMREHPTDTVLAEGHTCDEGDGQYNETLGLLRANAVRDYMIQMGIAPERLTVMSFGESAPAVPNTDEKNRKLNRRVVFQYTLGEPVMPGQRK